jgi:hypothetical protein
MSLIPLPDNTHHSQETDIHAPGGIRTRNTSKRTAADPCLRPRGHRDRPSEDTWIQMLIFSLQTLLEICGGLR